MFGVLLGLFEVLLGLFGVLLGLFGVLWGCLGLVEVSQTTDLSPAADDVAA